jgi:hypothetical protein
MDPAEFFKKADTDGSGGISKSELAAMLKNAPKPDGMAGVEAPSGANGADNIDEIFALVDTDDDGQISAAENKAHMEEMAKNGPGKPESMSGAAERKGQFDKLILRSSLIKNTSTAHWSLALMHQLRAVLGLRGCRG